MNLNEQILNQTFDLVKNFAKLPSLAIF